MLIKPLGLKRNEGENITKRNKLPYEIQVIVSRLQEYKFERLSTAAGGIKSQHNQIQGTKNV